MNRKLSVFFALVGLAIIIAVAPVIGFRTANPFSQCTQAVHRAMGGNMMGENDMMGGDGMMGGNSDMQVVRQLFAYHDQIRRSVEEIPGGVQTLTESDNPEVAKLIQQHVASMHQRLEDGRWFAMMSRTLPILFRNADRYQRQSQITPDGIAVTKTSDDAELASVLSEHAQEVTQFVQSGMPQMGRGRMRQ